mgnify:CR=1 FL=1
MYFIFFHSQTLYPGCTCFIEFILVKTKGSFDFQDVNTDADAMYIRLEVQEVDDYQHVDESDAGKVIHWLQSNYSASGKNTTSDPDVNKSRGLKSVKRHSLNSEQTRCTDFPGNWKLIPKSVEQFASRFTHQCDDLHGDSCTLRDQTNPTQNILNSTPVHSRLHHLPLDHQIRCEIRSHSSDSAIGGSGERLWNERRTPVLKTPVTESEILQDLIQPEDSASACPVNEPYPDYSSQPSVLNKYRSYDSELSEILREFEGHLTKHEGQVV